MLRATKTAAAPPAARHSAVDALRGLAMLWMTAFHFCFDLQYLRFIQADFYRDPFWTWQRSAIVSLFLACAGAGQALAHAQGLGWTRFMRRWAQVAGAALLVTLGSWWMFPGSFIYFGILHGMALMLPLARLLAPWAQRRAGACLVLGAFLLAAPWWAPMLHAAAGGALEPLNTPAWNWLGLINRKPVTEDYAPLLPWMGMVLWGLVAAQTWLAHGARWGAAWAQRPVGLRLAKLGRWSLSYYLLHQPVLLGLLMALALLR